MEEIETQKALRDRLVLAALRGEEVAVEPEAKEPEPEEIEEPVGDEEAEDE